MSLLLTAVDARSNTQMSAGKTLCISQWHQTYRERLLGDSFVTDSSCTIILFSSLEDRTFLTASSESSGFSGLSATASLCCQSSLLFDDFHVFVGLYHLCVSILNSCKKCFDFSHLYCWWRLQWIGIQLKVKTVKETVKQTNKNPNKMPFKAFLWGTQNEICWSCLEYIQ